VNRVIVSRRAQADLDEIWRFIALRSGEDRATIVVEGLLKSARTLLTAPLAGRRDDLLPDLRSWAVKPHVIFYRPVGRSVRLLRILHGKRNITSDLF
jgi:toxin ParE1/3/4